MNLTPTELERLTIFTAAELARRYRSQGIRLSHPEAVALISDEVLTAARKGMTHADLVDYGRSLLTTDDVEPGVEHMIPFLCVEACMAEGTKLVTVFDPIKPGPTKPGRTAQAAEPSRIEPIPGEIITQAGEIEINAGRESVSVDVLNTGDRAIQVRSHAHFFEVNRALKFDRAASFGMRLDRPSGTGIRFEPGEIVHVHLVRIGGTGNVRGFGRLTEGSIHSGEVKQRGLRLAKERGYRGA
ncbi:MAG: urease subunit beta [Betaproteobacteria bacterium]|nr:urease subunit beta [Betaproteobacteria bacterium]